MIADNPFWEFSLAFYERPRVANACLVLQDEYGLDVNVLLLMCWCGLHGVPVDDVALARLERNARLRCLRGLVIEPVRRVRRGIDRRRCGWLRAGRRALGALELAAERVEQDLLYKWYGRRRPLCQFGPVQPVVMIANLAGLWRGHQLPAASAQHARILLEESFPAWSAVEFRALWAACR